jgi:hypothetical protein
MTDWGARDRLRLGRLRWSFVFFDFPFCTIDGEAAFGIWQVRFGEDAVEIRVVLVIER